MEAVAAAVAVVGTLLGVLLQHRFQRQNVIEAGEVARLEKLRQERLLACAEYAGALAQYRRGQIDRWYARYQRDGSSVPEHDHEVRRQRDIAQQALFRLQLLSDSEEIVRQAESLFVSMNGFKPASSRHEVEAVRDSTHARIREFVCAAGRDLDPAGPVRAHADQRGRSTR